MRLPSLRALCLPILILLISVSSCVAQQNANSKRAVPIEPIAGILDAFHSHPIVALGEGSHGNLQGHAFRLSLIRHPRFARTVQYIVVEFGSARYQDLMDRYLHGEEIPDTSLRQAWMNTTQPDTIWDLSIYEEFFREVRSVNASLKKEDRVRVLLGDPPIDWDNVHTSQDLNRWATQRDSHAADLIQKHVLDKGKRALIIYGDEHLTHNGEGIVARLEKAGAARVLAIHTETRLDLQTLQPDIGTWPRPSLAWIRNTPLGVAKAGTASQLQAAGQEDRFDCILYLGPPATITIAQLPRNLCADSNYMEMRTRRMALVPPPPGAPFNPIDRLKENCALGDSNTEIEDNDPRVTKMVADILRDAAIGKVDPSRIAPASQERLIRFLRENGPRFLGSSGSLKSLQLLADGNTGEKRIRRYRAVFSSGQKMLWTIGISPQGTILSLDARRE